MSCGAPQAVRAEVLAGMRPVEEEAATRELLRLLTWVDVDEPLAEAAGALGRRFLHSHPGIEVTDLIVAALTLHLDGVLKTTNLKHFPMFTRLKAPY